MRFLKRLFSILGTILLVVLLAVVVLMFNARISGDVPSVFGYQVFRVSSGSMEPELMIGDVIIVKQAEPEDIQKGDIVTYRGEVGTFDGKFITHKMIEDPQYINGEYVFRTQGILEGAQPDPEWYEDQLIGEYVCTVPYIDALYSFFVTPYGLIVFVLIIMALFGYELIALIVSYKSLDEIDDDNNNSEDEQDERDRSDYSDDYEI